MAQVKTFPFSNLIQPINKAPRLSFSGTPSNISGASSVPDSRSQTQTFNSRLYQQTQNTPTNVYYGPNIITGLPVTSSVAEFGQTLNLEVEVSGYPREQFIYQWYQNGTSFNADANRTIVNNPSGSVLTIAQVQNSDDDSTYSLRITNPYNDASESTGNYAETSTYIYVDASLYQPEVLFTVIGAIQ